jgi:hypothetical protein
MIVYAKSVIDFLRSIPAPVYTGDFLLDPSYLNELKFMKKHDYSKPEITKVHRELYDLLVVNFNQSPQPLEKLTKIYHSPVKYPHRSGFYFPISHNVVKLHDDVEAAVHTAGSEDINILKSLDSGSVLQNLPEELRSEKLLYPERRYALDTNTQSFNDAVEKVYQGRMNSKMARMNEDLTANIDFEQKYYNSVENLTKKVLVNIRPDSSHIKIQRLWTTSTISLVKTVNTFLSGIKPLLIEYSKVNKLGDFGLGYSTLKGTWNGETIEIPKSEIGKQSKNGVLLMRYDSDPDKPNFISPVSSKDIDDKDKIRSLNPMSTLIREEDLNLNSDSAYENAFLRKGIIAGKNEGDDDVEVVFFDIHEFIGYFWNLIAFSSPFKSTVPYPELVVSTNLSDSFKSLALFVNTFDNSVNLRALNKAKNIYPDVALSAIKRTAVEGVYHDHSIYIHDLVTDAISIVKHTPSMDFYLPLYKKENIGPSYFISQLPTTVMWNLTYPKSYGVSTLPSDYETKLMKEGFIDLSYGSRVSSYLGFPIPDVFDAQLTIRVKLIRGKAQSGVVSLGWEIGGMFFEFTKIGSTRLRYIEELLKATDTMASTVLSQIVTHIVDDKITLTPEKDEWINTFNKFTFTYDNKRYYMSEAVVRTMLDSLIERVIEHYNIIPMQEDVSIHFESLFDTMIFYAASDENIEFPLSIYEKILLRGASTSEDESNDPSEICIKCVDGVYLTIPKKLSSVGVE